MSRRRGARKVVIGVGTDEKEVCEQARDIAAGFDDGATVAFGTLGKDRMMETCSVVVTAKEPLEAEKDPLVVYALCKGLPVVKPEWIMERVTRGEWCEDEEVLEKFAVFPKVESERVNSGQEVFEGVPVKLAEDLPATSVSIVKALCKQVGAKCTKQNNSRFQVVADGASIGNAEERVTLAGLIACIFQGRCPDGTPKKQNSEKVNKKEAVEKSKKATKPSGKATVSTEKAVTNTEIENGQESSVSADIVLEKKAKGKGTTKESSKKAAQHSDESKKKEDEEEGGVDQVEEASRAKMNDKESKKPKQRKAAEKKKVNSTTKSSKKEDSNVEKQVDEKEEVVPSKVKKIVMATSGLPVEELEVVMQAVKRIGAEGGQVAKLIDDSFADKATHILLPTLEKEKRTIKVMNGIARGAWIVKTSWVYESVENGFWVNEENHEAAVEFPGAKLMRKKKEAKSKAPTLLAGQAVLIKGKTNPSVPVLEHLIRSARGTVASIPQDANICIASAVALNEMSFEDLKQFDAVVPEKWLFDGIQMGSFDEVTSKENKSKGRSSSKQVQEQISASNETEKSVSGTKETKKKSKGENSSKITDKQKPKVGIPKPSKSKKGSAEAVLSMDDVMADVPTKKVKKNPPKRKSPASSVKQRQTKRPPKEESDESSESDASMDMEDEMASPSI